MSKMKPEYRRPPLAKSPIRLRPPRLVPVSAGTSLRSLTKSQKVSPTTWQKEEMDLRPEYRTISCELRALAKMVREEFGDQEDSTAAGVAVVFGDSSSSAALFERGRFYEDYSARRNERLNKRKSRGGVVDDGKTPYNCKKLGVTVESSKRRDYSKKLEGRRKSVSVAAAAAYSFGENPPPRYMLRSLTKKPPPLVPVNFDGSATVAGDKKSTVARRVRKI